MKIVYNPMRCPVCPKCEQDRMYWRTDSMAWVCEGEKCDGYCTKEEFNRGLEEWRQQRESTEESVNQAMLEGRHNAAAAIALGEVFNMKPLSSAARNGTRSRYDKN